MISRTISTSEKVHKVSVESRLLYTWMILHCDDEGRMQGSPATVKAMVMPMADFTIEKIGKMLKELQKARLIIWYKIKEKRYIQIIKWDDHQTFHGIHQVPSKIPISPSLVSSNTQVPAKLSKVKLSKVKEVKLSKEEEEKFNFSNFKHIGKKMDNAFAEETY
jgi:hypothetical protein